MDGSVPGLTGLHVHSGVETVCDKHAPAYVRAGGPRPSAHLIWSTQAKLRRPHHRQLSPVDYVVATYHLSFAVHLPPRPQHPPSFRSPSLSRTATMAAPPTLPPMESTDSFNPDFNNMAGPANGTSHADGPLSSPIEAPAPAAPAAQLHDNRQDAAPDPQVQQKVHDVLHSDIGVNTLLNRLKASIASARVPMSRFLRQESR